jgi:hypothetical protein
MNYSTHMLLRIYVVETMLLQFFSDIPVVYSYFQQVIEA